jgi:hypothetical protein
LPLPTTYEEVLDAAADLTAGDVYGIVDSMLQEIALSDRDPEAAAVRGCRSGLRDWRLATHRVTADLQFSILTLLQKGVSA